ncbi:uncharacterized protein Eint_091260 [Encephalitozoon intestinalis ATCC 50506]|uniref:Leucine-rich repeat-containing protein n=1 Tax=Encephalitozoon intestinalis (strain ATCC 50506) TaxID=876142 RepID=E0S8Y9_ENCIT|nr:uncharacterized protein Eint_091260 [Encephalitozoon intestinalis ATCC 50506]ADM12255.1 hypothetical protein Eint_091260 [Encephalitozoon intestinalis ATCC 50506]UTX46062.1 leucine-rich repeat domain-containing protein [Encephalitozoon intestinalis]
MNTKLRISILPFFLMHVLCSDNMNEALSIIKNLEDLKICDLHDMDLEFISPEMMEALKRNKKIRKLDLSDNKLKELPSDFGCLEWIEEVDASNNRIRRLPRSMKNMKNLKVLNLSNNRLRFFPWYLLKLRKEGIGSLRMLDLRCNPFYRIYHTSIARFLLNLFFGEIVKTGTEREQVSSTD